MEEELRRIHSVLAPRAQAVRDAQRAKHDAYIADLKTKRAAVGASVLWDVAGVLRACVDGKSVDHIVTHTLFGEKVSYACLENSKGLSLSCDDGAGAVVYDCRVCGAGGVFDAEVVPAVRKAGFATASSADGKQYVLTSKADVQVYNARWNDERFY